MSAAAISGSFSHASCSGMMRSGCVPAHSSMCQSFHARSDASPSSWSLVFEKIVPANPAISDVGAYHMPVRTETGLRLKTVVNR